MNCQVTSRPTEFDRRRMTYESLRWESFIFVGDWAEDHRELGDILFQRKFQLCKEAQADSTITQIPERSVDPRVARPLMSKGSLRSRDRKRAKETSHLAIAMAQLCHRYGGFERGRQVPSELKTQGYLNFSEHRRGARVRSSAS